MYVKLHVKSTTSIRLLALQSLFFYYFINTAVTMAFPQHHFLNDLSPCHRHVKFVNFSVSSLGIIGQSCNSFIRICTNLAIYKRHFNAIITKVRRSVMIRTASYIQEYFTQPITSKICVTNHGLTRILSL